MAGLAAAGGKMEEELLLFRTSVGWFVVRGDDRRNDAVCGVTACQILKKMGHNPGA
jgi:hypothetical protein